MGRYKPLIIVVLLSLLSSAVLLHSARDRSFMSLMIYFTGIFFLYLSTFKLWDLNGFCDGFQKYDLLASKSRTYAMIYPFLELLIAICMLAHFFVAGIALFTVILMVFGAIGVFKSLKVTQDLKCACMGTKLDLPLTTVSIVENVGMGLMSILIFIFTV